MKTLQKILGPVLCFVLSAALLAGCSTASERSDSTQALTTEESTTAAQSEKWVWHKDTPENQGIDGNVLSDLRDALDETQVFSCVIARNGKIVDAYYKTGYDENSKFLLWSCSKSVTSALIGIAIDAGYIESVDVPVSDYFPQVLESGNEYWAEMTLRHLLTHTSGIDMDEYATWDAWRASPNWVEYILNRPVASKPGTVFNYSTGNTHLLCAILQQATGKTLYEFGKEYLFDPVGMDSVTCAADAQGVTDGGNGYYMNVYDMAKFGQLYLNNGMWQGKQIVPESWIRASTSVQFTRSTGTADYGYQWWVRTFGDAKYDAFFAQGYAGQFIFVVPALELVVVFTSNHTSGSTMYWNFMNDIVAACTVE